MLVRRLGGNYRKAQALGNGYSFIFACNQALRTRNNGDTGFCSQLSCSVFEPECFNALWGWTNEDQASAGDVSCEIGVLRQEPISRYDSIRVPFLCNFNNLVSALSRQSLILKSDVPLY